jgi:hypothetical protein
MIADKAFDWDSFLKVFIPGLIKALREPLSETEKIESRRVMEEIISNHGRLQS